MILTVLRLDCLIKERETMLVRLITERDIDTTLFLTLYRKGGRDVCSVHPARPNQPSLPLYKGPFYFKEFAMTLRQTTVMESAILPSLTKLGIPGANLIAWSEDAIPKENRFSLFLEFHGGEGFCLVLDVELHKDFLPCGSNWYMVRREDVVAFLAGGDPEYEGHNFLVSTDPYWRNAIEAKSA